ncbi:unnamed protein product [Effrenium voratum]|nr:unnamed protein product [Effrenium voratum]
MMEEIDYDEKCLQAFENNMRSFELRCLHQKDTWLKKKLDRARDAANTWWDSKVIPFCWPDKFDGGTALEMMKDLELSVEKWMASIKLRQSGWVYICNYTAPSLIKADVSTSFMKLMGQMISSNHSQDSIGLLLCPGWSRTNGSLFSTEFGLLKVLSESGCVVDNTFQLLFDVKTRTGALKYTQVGGDAADKLLRSATAPSPNIAVGNFLEGFMTLQQSMNNVMVYVDGAVATIELPDSLVKKWWDTKPEFKTFVEEFQARHPLAKTMKAQAKASSESLRTGKLATTTPSRKRAAPKDHSKHLVSVAEAPGGTVLVESPLINVRVPAGSEGVPSLVVTEAGAHIKNECGNTVTLPFGLVVCGFGKGKFKEISPDKPLEDSECGFDPVPEMLAMLDNKVASFSEHLNHAKMNKPECVKLCYHTVKQEPNQNWSFTKDREKVC